MRPLTTRRQSMDRADRGNRGHQDCMEGTWRNVRVTVRAQRESSERERGLREDQEGEEIEKRKSRELENTSKDESMERV
eukprot:1261088-Rhodomonas_salina.1